MDANNTYFLTEAFQELNMLNEETFEATNDGIAAMSNFVKEDELTKDNTVEVIDTEAKTEEDLQNDYVGKVILDCCMCHSVQYKGIDDVIIDEETGFANVGEECPVCYTTDGYTVIGQVAPFKDAPEIKVDIQKKEEPDNVEEVEDETKEDKATEKNEGLKARHLRSRNTKKLAESKVVKTPSKLSLKEGRMSKLPKINPSARKLHESRKLVESQELDRELFVSLVKLGDHAYSILNDGYFVAKISAKSDDEAIRIFRKFLKTDWKRHWKADNLPTYANDFINESKKVRPSRKRNVIESKRRIIGKRLAESKEKMVIYTDLDGYKVTPESNYNAHIQNARQVMDAKDFSTPQEIVDYYVKYGWADAGDFIIVESTKTESHRRTRKTPVMSEDLNNISLDTETEHITISSTEKEDVDTEETMIAPLSDEVKDDIIANSESEEDFDFNDIDIDEEPTEDEDTLEADDFDVESFDDMEESYLKRAYANVKSYKTTRVTESTDNKLCVEGVVKFKSGKSKAVKTMFEGKYADRTGKVVLKGTRVQKDNFGKLVRLEGKIRNGSIITEKLLSSSIKARKTK